MTLKVLIVGGYGTFGGRLVALLENEPGVVLMVAGRSVERARGFCAGRGAVAAELVPCAFDRNGDVHAQIASLKPGILVDASGPFQAYGARRYAVIEACVALGVNYLDLADGSDFVAGVADFDAAARARGVYVLSGVSTCPVLTAAAVRRLSGGMTRVDSIRGGIAPSPFAGIGENVVHAIAGYAGKPVPLKRNGADAVGYPFTEQMRFTVSPPGEVPLKSTLFSLVDVPDLRALPQLWPQVNDVWVGAGPVPAFLHRVLIAFAWAVRWRTLPSLTFLAPLIHSVTERLRWGEHRGGMFVEVQGADSSGIPVTRSWNLLAEGDSGPFIPSMPVAAIVKKVLRGRAPEPGARASLHDVELEDYEPLFAERKIVTGIRKEVAADAPLYRRIFGAAWRRLPEPIRAMHDVTDELAAEGRADIDRGAGPLARLVAGIIGFPKAGRDVPVSVQFQVANGVETWTRIFAGKKFSSVQSEGRGRNKYLLCERFGPLVFAMALSIDGDHVRLTLRRWSAFGIPLPMFLCPRSDSYETVADGRFRFHVDIRLPLIGLIVRYRGWLEPRTGPKLS